MRRKLPALLRSAFKTQLNRFSHVAQCFLSRPALADTAGNHGTLRYYVSVIADVEYDWQLH